MEHYSVSRSLHRFAIVTCLATLGLVALGGLVTSHGVGMAVPDWPNTYGYNMFFFPLSQWVGGIFYEHTHRLLASTVGLLTTVLALWLHGTRARRFMRAVGAVLLLLAMVVLVASPARWTDAVVLAATGAAGLGASFFWPRSEPAPRWLRRLGLIAFGAVVLQGVLGGLRVTAIKDEIGIFHAVLAQLFFCLTCALVLFTSRWWSSRVSASPRLLSSVSRGSGGIADRMGPLTPVLSPSEGERENHREVSGSSMPRPPLSFPILVTTLLILVQLALGATMRHAHAGLAIPDFPLAYGKIWPDMSTTAVERYNQQRLEVTAVKDITAVQIGLQMAHRLLAVAILASVGWSAWKTRRSFPRRDPLPRLALFWCGLILAQVLLGAWTIWSNKAADVATAHVLVGTLSLATGAIMCIIRIRLPSDAPGPAETRVPAPVASSRSAGIQAAAGSL